MEALVQLSGVTRRYDGGAAAVDEVSLQIAAGEAVAVTVAGQRVDRLSETGVARFKRAGVKRGAIALAGAVAAGLLAAACSSSPPAPSVASLPGHSSAAGGGAMGQLTRAQSDRDMVNFAHCMRAHGVQMPDPFHIPGHTGLSIYDPPRTAATRAAWAACGHFVQPTVNMKQGHQQALAALRLRALTDYARCMRAHDIAMLDPTALGQLNLGNVPGISGHFGRSSPQFRSADTACRHLLPAGVVDNGTGP